MIKRRDLVIAMATALANIPEVLAELAPTDPVVAYIDLTPRNNSLDKAVYQMQPGQLLVYWSETNLILDQMSRWSHVVEICLRAGRERSDMDLADLIMNGIPVPGDGMVWRYCPLIPGVLPTDVSGLARRTDSEGVDYHVIITETAETGDWTA